MAPGRDFEFENDRSYMPENVVFQAGFEEQDRKVRLIDERNDPCDRF
jgi:hypothetical protein